MKKLSILALVAILGVFITAQVHITTVDKVAPTDEMFMDMAVTAAETAKEQGLKPCGAVVILNGAWRSTGMASGDKTAEEAAIEKSRRKTLNSATIFTVNQPTSQALNAIMQAGGADAVYFVNPAADVIAAGIYPASAYDESLIDTTLTAVPVRQIDYAPAKAIIK